MKNLIYILIILLTSAICSCRSIQYVPVVTVKSDTTYINKLQRDSIYERDSIFIRSKGDTVLIEKFKYKYVDRLVRDTSYVSRVDSIQVPYPVEKQLTRWESFKMSVGGYAIVIGIISIILFVIILIKRFM